MEKQKKPYNQLVTEEPLGGAKSAISEDTINQIRDGDLGKSDPGSRVEADDRKAVNNRSPKGAKSQSGGSWFAKAWMPNHSNRLGPAGANRLS